MARTDPGRFRSSRPGRQGCEISAKSASRRRSSKMGCNLVQEDQRRGAFELLDQLGFGKDRARSAAPSARRRSSAPPAAFLGRESRIKSLKCGPSSARAAARSRSRPCASSARNSSSTSVAGSRDSASSSRPRARSRPTGRGLARALRASARSARQAARPHRAARRRWPCRLRPSAPPGPRTQRGSPRASGTAGSAAAWRGRSGLRGAAHLGIDGKHQPVEETPPLGRRPVNSPSMAGISQTSCTCSARAPALASLPAMRTVRPLLSSMLPAGNAGADLDLVLARHDLGGDGEAAGAVLAAKLGIGAAAQAACPAPSSETASSRLVLPEPLSPISTTGRASSLSSARA